MKNNDLSAEIRQKQALATFKIIKKFLNKYPKIKAKKQIGKLTFNQRKNYFSNKLNINKPIKKTIQYHENFRQREIPIIFQDL